MDQEVTQLEEQNSKLSKNISDLNANVEANLTNDDGSELNKQIAEVAKKFVELYPVYDIEKVEEKKADLEKIATPSVADSIVPDDMITTSKKTLESKSTTQKEKHIQVIQHSKVNIKIQNYIRIMLTPILLIILLK